MAPSCVGPACAFAARWGSVACVKGGFGNYISSLKKGVGTRFLVMVVVVFLLLKGSLWALAYEGLLPLYRQMGLDGVSYQRAIATCLTPWGMKGVIGALSDAVPLYGYRKRYYMLAANVLGSTCVALLLLLPLHYLQLHARFLLPLLFLGVHTQIAVIDLLSEGVYSEIIRQRPSIGSPLVAFVNLCISSGSLLARLLVGPVCDALGAWPLVLLALPLSLSSFFPIYWNFIEEEPLRIEEAESVSVDRVGAASREGPGLSAESEGGDLSSGFQREETKDENVSGEGDARGVFVVALTTSACSFLLAAATLSGSETAMLASAGGIVTLLLFVTVCNLRGSLAKCSCYFFLDTLLHLSIRGALNFFYTADERCVPGGPHFSYTYFSTYTSIAGTCASWVGIFCFNKWMKHWSCRTIFWVTNSLRILASGFDLVLVLRLNRILLLPDKLVYILGDAVVFNAIMSLSHMASVITVARLCPKGLECTVNAVVSGLSNLGWTVSKVLGAKAIATLGIKTTVSASGGVCDFSSLPSLLVLAHAVLPAFTVPLSVLLLPSEPMQMRKTEEDAAHTGKPDAPISTPSSSKKDSLQHSKNSRHSRFSFRGGTGSSIPKYAPLADASNSQFARDAGRVEELSSEIEMASRTQSGSPEADLETATRFTSEPAGNEFDSPAHEEKMEEKGQEAPQGGTTPDAPWQ